LYVNVGDEKLPSREGSDIVSSTAKSEVITIDKKNKVFEKKGLKSMRGRYIVGVYGVKKSNFTIVLSQEKYPLALLLDN
jgi:hypothetical protein